MSRDTAQHLAEVGAAAAKGAPSAGVSGLILLGYPVHEWVVVITGLYTLALLGNLMWRWRRDWRASRAAT